MRATEVCYAVCLVALGGGSAAAGTNNVRLAWDASLDTNVVGYYVYWGNESPVYTEFAYAANSTTCTVSNLDDGLVYFFVVTAVDADGLESNPSNEVRFSTPGVVRLKIETGNEEAVRLRFPGYSGLSASLQASEDLVQWDTIRFVSPAEDGWLEYWDAITGRRARFYRLRYGLPP